MSKHRAPETPLSLRLLAVVCGTCLLTAGALGIYTLTGPRIPVPVQAAATLPTRTTGLVSPAVLEIEPDYLKAMRSPPPVDMPSSQAPPVTVATTSSRSTAATKAAPKPTKTTAKTTAKTAKTATKTSSTPTTSKTPTTTESPTATQPPKPVEAVRVEEKTACPLDDKDGSGSPRFGGVKAGVVQAGLDLRCRFNIKTVLGVAGRGGPSDHPEGKALDFMVDRSTGDKLADYVLAHQKELGVKYVIWRQRYNDGSGWDEMPDRGGKTANHFDHLHASFN